MGVEILVPLGAFAMVVALVVWPRYLKSRDRQRLLDTMRVAFERGQPVPPDVLDALAFDEKGKRQGPDRDLRSGITLVAVALAFITLGLTIGHVEGDREAMIVAAIGAFPGFVGLGQLAVWFVRRNRTDV
jgi:hypothetical protein